MVIHPRQGIANVVRIADAVEDRSQFVCLDKNERIDPFPDAVLEGLRKVVRGCDLSGYPVIEPFRSTVANWIGVKPEQVLPTAGSDAAIRAVFDTFVSPGDRIVILQPTFAMFAVYARLFQGELVEIDCGADLSVPVDRLLDEINRGARVICLPNPNSPTGTSVEPRMVRGLAESAANKGAVLLIDEAYWEFAGRSELDLLSEFTNVIITRTFSKAAGLAGVRLGFLVAAPEMIDLLRRPKPMYEISGHALRMGEYLIREDDVIRDYVAEVRKSRIFTSKQMEGTGFSPFPSLANFVVAKVPSGLDGPVIGQRLRERGYLIKSGYNFLPMRGTIRVSLALPETMRGFCSALQDVVIQLTEHEGIS